MKKKTNEDKQKKKDIQEAKKTIKSLKTQCIIKVKNMN